MLLVASNVTWSHDHLVQVTLLLDSHEHMAEAIVYLMWVRFIVDISGPPMSPYGPWYSLISPLLTPMEPWPLCTPMSHFEPLWMPLSLFGWSFEDTFDTQHFLVSSSKFSWNNWSIIASCQSIWHSTVNCWKTFHVLRLMVEFWVHTYACFHLKGPCMGVFLTNY